MSRIRHRNRFSVFLGMIAALVLFVTGTGTAAATTDVQQTGGDGFTAEAAVYSEDGEFLRQQMVYCEYDWAAAWTGGNPTDLTYSVEFWCLTDPTGPEILGTVQARLFDDTDTLLDEGPEAPLMPFDPTETVSESTVSLERPQTVWVNDFSEAILFPTTGGQVWLWTFLPDGCLGVGTATAICDIRYEEFTV